MLRKALFIIIFALPALPGLGQYESVLHKTYAQRYLFIDSEFYNGKAQQQDSVVYFIQLNALASAAKQAGDKELELEAEFIRCEYYLWGRQTNYPLFERRTQTLKEISDDKKISHLQIRTRQALGYYYLHSDDKYVLSFDNYLSSYQLLKATPIEEIPNKQSMVANIGIAYYKFGDKQMALKFLSEAWALPPTNKKRDLINISNTLGLIYRGERNFKSADYYLQKTYEIAEAAGDSTWMGIAAGNLGSSYFLQKKYDQAIPLLLHDVKASLKVSEIDNAMISLGILARISLLKNDLTQAQAQIKQINELLPRSAQPFLRKVDLYPVVAKYYAAKGDFARAYIYSDSAYVGQDSLHTNYRRRIATKPDRKFELQLHNAEMQRLSAEKNLQKTIRNSLVTGILLLLIITVLFINRQRLIHRQKQEKLQAKNKTISHELELASQKLRDFTHHIREKNKLIEEFSAELEKHKNQLSTPDQIANKEARDKLLHSTILTDEQWREFRLVFDKVHAGYLDRLRAKLPNLSPAETRYLVLSKLDLSVKEMSNMLGISPDAIRLCRHRLRKKMGIGDDKVLEELVQEI